MAKILRRGKVANRLVRPPSRQKKRPTVSRKIHFFRAELADHRGEGNSINTDRMCQLLSGLKWHEESENRAYWEPELGTLHGALVDDEVAEFGLPKRKRLRFFTIRRNDLPLVEFQGEFSPLTIPPRGGLAEAVFVTFFPNNIVGAIYNFHGPRLPRLGAYLQATLKEFPRVIFSPLIRTDALARLDELRALTSLKVRMSREAIAHFGGNNRSIREMFGMLAEFSDATSVEIVLRTNRKASLSQRAVRLATDLFQYAARGSVEQEGVEDLVVRGHDTYTGRLATFDLLADQFIVNEQIVTQGLRSRALDVNAAYAAIESAYAQIKRDLETASTVTIEDR